MAESSSHNISLAAPIRSARPGRHAARRTALVLVALGACSQLSWKGIDAGLIGLAVLGVTCLADASRNAGEHGKGGLEALASVCILSPLHLAVVCFVLVTLGYHGCALPALRETAQLLVLLVVGGKVGSLLADDDLSILAKALTVALCGSVAVALCQLAWPGAGQSLLTTMYGPPYVDGGTGPLLAEEIATGLLPSQCLYAALLVISFPFVLSALGIASPMALVLCGLIALALAAQTIIAGTALLGLALVALLTLRMGPSRWRVLSPWLSTALILVIVALGACHLFGPAAAPSPWESLQPFAESSSGERTAKRSVTEAAAVIANAHDHLLGWGAGTFQASVSKARIRAQLPPPQQDRVKRDSTSQYVVAALEFGPPMSVLLLLLFVGAVVTGFERQSALPGRGRSGHGAAVLASTVGITWMALAGLLLVRGLGPLVGLIAGAAAHGPRHNSPRPALRLASQAGLILGALGLGLLVKPMRNTVTHQIADVSRSDIVIEAETCRDKPDSFIIRPANHTGGNRVLTIPEGTGKGVGAVSYRVPVPATGAYKLWMRVKWEDACGNSVHCRLADSPTLTIEDAIFGRWHWVDIAPDHVFELEQGKTELVLQNAEDGVHIDQIALFANRNAMPVGILGSAEPPGKEEGPAPEAPRLDLEAEEGPVEDAFDKYAE